MATYTITPQDYQYLQAMLTHEAQNTLQNDLNRGNLNSAYGQMTGLVETWLNRAMAKGTDLPSQMLAKNQLSYFSADKVPTEAAQLDPRITQMLNTYLHSRNAGDPGILGSVNQYLNRDVTDALYSQKYRDWYDKSQLLGAFGDKRSGGRSSLEQEFLNNPEWQVPQYDVRVSPQIQLNPSEGDVNALTDFRNSYLMPTPLPPGRPANGLAGIVPRGPGEGNYEPGILDQFSDGITRGLETVGQGASDLFNGLFGGAAPPNPAPGDYDFATGLNVGGNPGLGLFGSGVSPLAPTDTSFAGGFNPSQQITNGVLAQLPAGFDASAYLRANPDLAAAGVDPIAHYMTAGFKESRPLTPGGVIQSIGPDGTVRTHAADGTITGTLAAPNFSSTIGGPGLSPTLGPSTTPTVGSGSTASTIGAPNAISGLPPGFDAQSYALANPDVAASGQDPTQHFLNWGRFDVRALAPGQEARVHAAPGSISPYGGTVQASTLGPFGTTPTIGPDGGINVVSTGLTPTVGPGATVQSFSPSGGSDFLTMPSTTATTLGPPATSNSLPAFFSPQDYIAANRDLAGMTNQQAIDHYTNYGQYETRALAPWLQAQVHAAPGLTPTIGAGNPVSTTGAPSLTPTLDTATPVSTIGPPALTGTYGPPATTPTLNPTTTTPSWSPFGGAGIGSPFGFSGSNVGGGLGAGPQTFGSYYPVGSGGTDTAPASSGPDMSNPFGFTNMDVSGFDANAYGGGGGGGGSEVDLNFGSGFDEAGAMRNVLAQQAEALRLKDLAVKTPMHTDPNAFNAVLANGGNAVGFGTPLQNPGAVQAPVVPNLTVTNAAMGAPGAMFSMFAPWR